MTTTTKLYKIIYINNNEILEKQTDFLWEWWIINRQKNIIFDIFYNL